MKKVLFFIPTLTGGGAEKVLVNLVNNMDRKKFDITVQTLFDVGVNKRFLNKNIKYRYVFKRLFRGNVRLLKMIKPNTLYERMVKEEYDITVSYLQSPTMRIVSGCNDKNTRLICWIHNEFHELDLFDKIYRSRKELAESINNYDKIVFVAESARKALEKVLPEIRDKSCTIYNTIETDEIREKAEEKLETEFPVGRMNLISAGRFTKQKAFERLIRITARLKNDGFPVHLSLLGDGALWSEYEKLIDDMDLKNDVCLLGYRDNPYKYVKNADLFVCSSLYEGFSTAVTEALVVGTPVITTSCSGMEELLGSGGEYGIITENSEDELYKGIKKVLSDPVGLIRLKEAAKKRGDFFDKENTVKAAERILSE